MPKRDVKVISHSVLTNHRIVKTPQEPFPDVAFNMTTLELPDLVHLSASSDKASPPAPLILLQAYRQIMLSHPEYRPRYWDMGKRLQTTHPDDVPVLQALADAALQQKDMEGVRAAIRYLDRARMRGTTQPADFQQLAKMLIATKQEAKAIDVLRQGIDLIPYDIELYRLLARTYFSIKKTAEGCAVTDKAKQMFPQDSGLRDSFKQCELVERPGKGL
ncbi:MAG: hypothetical protein DME97_18740 [Verrucomicrobia bacterium]|nr:MAG: hypothetical protein DME97_18740 [Verrucomicrobiota bacterium]